MIPTIFIQIREFMQTFSFPGHLLSVNNIPYTINKDLFRQYLQQFGDISLYQEMIAQKGICFIDYFDSR